MNVARTMADASNFVATVWGRILAAVTPAFFCRQTERSAMVRYRHIVKSRVSAFIVWLLTESRVLSL